MLAACTCRQVWLADTGLLWRTATRRFASTSAPSSAPSPVAPSNRGKKWLFGSVGASAIGLAAYVLSQQREQEAQTLSPFHFVPLKLAAVERLTADTSLFTLSVPLSVVRDVRQRYVPNEETISSLYVMQPDVQIQRPYTPLSAAYLDDNDSERPEEVRFVVKRYADGEMSRWLHRLAPGDTIRVKGPVPTWTPPATGFSEIVFIAGGTGIAPVYQFLERRRSSRPDPVKILYASQAPSHVLLRQELDRLAGPNIELKYLVDRPDSPQQPSLSATGEYEVGLIDEKRLKKWLGRHDPSRLIVVCGPEGMINYIAGPRPLRRPESSVRQERQEAKAGGLLGRLGYAEQQVVRL